MTAIDLSACEREPIHLLGTLQPHGVLLAFSEPDLRLEVVSANSASLLGEPPERLLGQSLAQVIPAALLPTLRDILEKQGTWPLRLELERRPLTGLVHRSDGLAVLELEQAPAGESTEGVLTEMDRCFAPLGRTHGLSTLLQWAAEQVRALTGFDRVMVYRFDGDWHGEVVAESRGEGVGSFLGLHFPASDIPSQARALYTRNPLRQIVHVGAAPVPLVPAVPPSLSRPLDLSDAALRSVSPVHLEYLSNMGVAASFSLSLLKEGRLWGLIACHHLTPRHISATVRRACELLVRLLALQVGAEERSALTAALARRVELRAQLVDHLSHSSQALSLALSRHGSLLLQSLQAGGAALLGEDSVLVGHTPPLPFVQELARWLAQRPATESLFHTEELSRLYPPAAAHVDRASGLLAVRLEADGSRLLLCFRPEVAQTVSWAGDPSLAVLPGAEGSQRLHPRGSFSEWKQVVRGRSTPWSWVDVQAAEGLRAGLLPLLRRKAAAQACTSAELQALSGSMAHDLKESLHSVLRYAKALREGSGQALVDSGQERLQDVEQKVKRTRKVLDALVEYSRWDHVGRVWGEADLHELVQEVLRSQATLYAQVQVRIPRRLPVVQCDAVRLRQVWLHLLSNAARYCSGPERWVEIGYLAPGEPLPLPGPRHTEEHAFYVRDNGVGIPEQSHEAIFTMFRRLHPGPAEAGNGGAGLALSRRLVRTYGGDLWVDSSPGQGATFYFTLGHPPT